MAAGDADCVAAGGGLSANRELACGLLSWSVFL